MVSPHPDDLALSIGGILALGFFRNPILGVTVFSKSANAPYGYTGISPFLKPLFSVKLRRFRYVLRNLETMEISRCRKNEDLYFFRSVNIPIVDLNLLDAPLRGYENVFSVSPVESDHCVDVIRSVMSRITSNLDGSLILPLGLGSHIDHIIVRDACHSLNPRFRKIYYEDLPYSASLSLEEIERGANLVDRSLVPHDIEITQSLAIKISGLELYHSQIGKREVDRIVKHAKRLSTRQGFAERLWYIEY